MPILEIFITFLFSFVVFVLPIQISSASPTTCRESQCKGNEPSIQFPFRLGDRQAPYCGYGPGFDLSCNFDKRTILSLPSSGDFMVEGIDYNDQLIWINDPESCFPKWLLDRDFSLVDSPFSYLYGLENSTFLNCSSQAAIRSSPIPCLSSEDYNVLVVPSGWFYADPNTTSTNSSLSPASLSPHCSVISTALVPRSSSVDPWNLNLGVLLAWDLPDCRSCQRSGRSCGFENATSSQKLVCTGFLDTGHSDSVISRAVKYGIVIGFGILALVCIIGVVICACKMNASGQAPQPAIRELSTVVGQQPPPAITGPPNALRISIEGETIESYPKTQLGESLELPNPNDKTCAICLCEYQRKETIRTISQCKHYFHANCIDEWFKKDVSCPLCRDQPNNGLLGLPRQSSQDTSALPNNGSLGLPRPALQNARVLYLDHMYLIGWEGSAHDSKVLNDAISRQNGLKVPPGKYYLGDCGFPNRRRFLAPFRGTRYHLKDFGGEGNHHVNAIELFNLRHTSLRNVIERIFGIFTSRFTIFKSAPPFSYKTQAELVLACAGLHNFLRQECRSDEFPPEPEDDPVDNQEDNFEWDDFQTQDQQRYNANEWRMSIANHMWTDAQPNAQPNANNENNDNEESGDEGEE